MKHSGSMIAFLHIPFTLPYAILRQTPPLPPFRSAKGGRGPGEAGREEVPAAPPPHPTNHPSNRYHST